MTATLLDCTLRYQEFLGDYRYSATFRAAGFVVRVRLCHDDCGNVSFAVAEVLGDGPVWTRLLRTRPPLPSGGAGNVAGLVEGFARDLLDEALAVLGRDGGVL